MRFYNLLSKGVNMKRIYLDAYLAELRLAFSTSILDQMFFAFRLLDIDMKFHVSPMDVSDVS